MVRARTYRRTSVAANGRLESLLCTPNEIQNETGQLSPIYCRRIGFQLYACWAVRGGTRVSDFIDACCPVCAKAEFIAGHFFDKAEEELNRMYSLIDNRTENR